MTLWTAGARVSPRATPLFASYSHTTMTKNSCATSHDTLRGAVRGLKWLFFAALICGIAPPATLLIWQTITPSVVIQRAGAGRFVPANTSSSFLQSALTTVTMTQDSLIVMGVFSAPSNQSLE